MIVIAGPNGSGKTSVTQKFLHHEWAEGTLYINPDEVAKDKYGDWNSPEAVLKAANLYINPDEVAKDKYGDWNSPEAVLKAANYCAELRETCLSERKSRLHTPLYQCGKDCQQSDERGT